MSSQLSEDEASTKSANDQIYGADASAHATAADSEGTTTAKSIKCVDCEKLFKTADLAAYHAEKSGHDNFEESVEEVYLQISSFLIPDKAAHWSRKED